jgi:bacteriorhodopsin
MVVQEQTLYTVGAAIIFTATVALALFVARVDGKRRKHIAPMPAILGILTLGYVGMALAPDPLVATSPDGKPVYFARFGTYLITYSYLMSYLGLIAGAKFRYRIMPAIAVVGFTGGTMVGQLASPPLNSLGSLIVIFSLIFVFWSFFRPLTRAAKSTTGARRLLFFKLRNLSSLIFIMYFLVAITNRANLGLLDAFVGVFTTAYVDLIGHIVFAGLVVYSAAGIEIVAGEYSSPLDTFKRK